MNYIGAFLFLAIVLAVFSYTQEQKYMDTWKESK